LPAGSSDTSPLREFFDALTEQEGKFAAKLATDNLGLFLRAAINELDWYSYNFARAAEPTFDQQEQFYLMHLGITRLIKLTLESRPSFDVPTVLFRRDRSITIPVLEIAIGLGMIEHGRRVAQMAMTGLGKVERTGPIEYIVTLPPVLPDDEYYERAVAEHFYAIAREDFEELLHSEIGRDMAADVERLLTELVHPFMDHFIGYDAHPTLDTYFFGVASHLLRMKEGYDAFHFAVSFGGVPFQTYMLGLTFLMSLAVRHERFAEALVKKVPGIRLENVLTVSAETAPFLDDMLAAINFFGSLFDDYEDATPEQVRTVFEVLSVGRENTKFLDRPGSPLPPMIRCSDNDFIRCQSAVLANPIQYLLDSLRHHFPGEYDQNQRTREQSMQRAVRRVLDDVIPGLEYRDNVHLRKGGRTLTDIDVVALEPATGTAVLIQLKHQDIYGMDIHSGHLRGRRLREQSERWLGAVADWTQSADGSEIRATLRVGADFPKVETFRVIVTRHFAHPLGGVTQAPDVAFANWNQFYNATLQARHRHERPTLADLVTLLREGERPGGPMQHEPEPRSEWNIDELRFTIRQEVAASESPER
jgi:hypothetical protein